MKGGEGKGFAWLLFTFFFFWFFNDYFDQLMGTMMFTSFLGMVMLELILFGFLMEVI